MIPWLLRNLSSLQYKALFQQKERTRKVFCLYLHCVIFLCNSAKSINTQKRAEYSHWYYCYMFIYVKRHATNFFEVTMCYKCASHLPEHPQ